MATDLGNAPKTAAAQKYEVFVEQQLARARRRIRSLDLTTGLLALFTSLVVYVSAISLLDRALALSAEVRAAALVLYAVAVLVYAGRWGWRLLRQEVNPYFAARRLEDTLPATKNSVLNWLDLRRAPLPAAIRGSLGRRAAKDLTQTDLDQAVSPRRVYWLAGVFFLLLVALLAWWALSPGQFLSLMQRALAPFEKINIAANTQLDLVHPKAGNLVLHKEQDVTVRVRISGRVPGVNEEKSPKIHYRYAAAGNYAHRPLERDPRAGNEWTFTIKRDVIRTGLLYKLSAGDAETDEYQIEVLGPPAVVRWEGTYQPRPYLGLKNLKFHVPDAKHHHFEPDLKHYRGTQVTLIAHTNRPWHKGNLIVQQGNKTDAWPGDAVAGDPQARQFSFVLDRQGTFKLLFKASDGAENTDQKGYKIEVIEDKAPTVTLTDAAKDLVLPANGVLRAAGFAEDDIGVKSMQLCVKIVKGAVPGVLQAKPYRPDRSFQLADKSYPQKLEYQDFLSLTTLKNARGESVKLAKGDELQCWLEARDNCDYPEASGNLGKSKPRKVLITDPEKNEEKTKKEQKEAKQKQDEHEQKQDQQQKDKNKDIKEKQEDQANGNQGMSEKEKEDFEKKIKAAEDAAKKQEQKGDSKGAGGQGGAGQNKKDEPGMGQENAGKEKDDGGMGNDANKGEGKDKGEPQQQPGPGAGKGADKKEGGQGESKGGDDKQKSPGEGSSEAKAGGDDKQQQSAGGAKEQGADKKGSETGAAKEGAGDKMGEQSAGADKQEGAKDAKGGEVAKAKNDGADKNDAQKSADKTAPPDMTAACKEKGSGGQGSGGSSQAKNDAQAPPDQQKTAQGSSKGQPQAADDANKKRDDATLDEVAKLNKDLQDQQKRDQAAKELDQVREEAKNAPVREAAEKALKDAGIGYRTEPGDGKGAQEDKTVKKGDAKGQVVDDAKNPPSGKAKTNPAKQDADGAKKEGPSKDEVAKAGETRDRGDGGQGGPKTKQSPDRTEIDPSKVDPNALKRKGNLILEDWRKKLKVSQDANTLKWTDQEVAQFLKQLQRYNQSLRNQGQPKSAKDQLTGKFQGSGVGPQEIGGTQQKVGTEGITLSSPPEFREAFIRFTAQPDGKKTPPK